MNFDFCYYPLVYRAGREGEAIPGMCVMDAPALAHRHRQHDLLAVLLTLSGDHRYDPEEIEALTSEAASSFFQVQGSVTRAIQALAESLNKQIFNRNLDRGYEGVRALAVLNVAVLHNDWLFLGQVGSTRALCINADMVEIFTEREDSGDYLGLSRRIQVRFSQTEMHAGDLLLLCERPPLSWTIQNLNGSASLSMPQVKRRLLSQVTDSLEALVVKIQAGRGRVAVGDWSESGQAPQTPSQPAAAAAAFIEPLHAASAGDNLDEVEQPAPAFEQSQPESEPEVEYEGEPEPEISQLEPESTQEEITQEEIAQDFDETGEAAEDEGQVPVIAGETEQPLLEGERPPQDNALPSSPGSFLLWMANAWMKLKAWNMKTRQFGQRITGRFNQKQFTERVGSPSFFMLILSLAIPLVLILASLTVYTRSGKSEEHQALLAEAQAMVVLAIDEKNAAQQRDYWAQALDLVTQAQDYDITRESQALFEQAQSNLDEMDLAGRLDFQPALTQFFPEDVVISHIQSSSSGVYLLDETTGSVLRISLNSKGFYELDSEFSCGPGPYGLTTVTKLVDFVVLPANADNYRVMALDQQGNLLYCRPGELPVSRSLSAPAGGWKRVIGAAYDDDILYVLDADKDEVWMYEGRNPEDLDSTGIIFSESPIKFLDEDVPDLGGAIDLTVNDEDLFILHADGHMSLCRYSALKDVKLTECQDPAPYSDSRAGQEKKPWIFLDSRFEIMQQTKLPNAAIYILDGANRSINKFSYQLNLEEVYKPQTSRSYPIPDTDPTGFGVTSEMEVFLAFKNQLFIAPLQ